MIGESIVKEYGKRLRMRVGGICIRNDQILLVNHSGLNEQNLFWAPPGGGLNYGETIEECLQREFVEETGFTIKVENFLCITEYLKPPLHALEMFFKVTIVNGVLKKGTDPEVTTENQIIKSVEFLSFNELQEIPDLEKHSLLQKVKNENDILDKAAYSNFR